MTTAEFRPRLRGVREYAWLVSAFLVPAIITSADFMVSPFQVPKVVLLRTLAGVIAVAWVAEMGLTPQGDARKAISSSASAFWAQTLSTRVLIGSTALFFGTAIVSTLTSLSLGASLWGRIPGTDGLGLYTLLAYAVLFIAVAAEARDAVRIERLMWAITLGGALAALYGLAQWLGVDPYDWREAGERIVATQGNAIYAGAYFVLTLPVALGLLALRFSRERVTMTTGLLAAVAALQLLAIGLTFSRGPWLGTVAVLGVFSASSVAVTIMASAKARRIVIGASAAAVGALVLLLLVPGLGAGVSERVQSQIRPGTAEESVTDLLASSADIRFQLWAASVDLLTAWPVPSVVDNPLGPVRSVVGYGPDLFQYALPLAATRELELKQGRGIGFHAAHNHYLQTGVELGLLGMGAYIALLASTLVVGVLRLRRRQSNGVAEWALIAVMAAIAGRSIEGMFGLAKVSDLTVFWLLAGLVVAIAWVPVTESPAPAAPRRARGRSRPAKSRPEPLIWWRVGLAVFLIGAVTMVTWDRNISHAWAANSAAAVLAATGTGSGDDAIRSINDAIDRAPDAAIYHIWRSEVLLAVVDSSPEASREAVATAALASAQRAQELDPLSPTAATARARAESTLLQMGLDRGTGLIAANEYALALQPSRWTAMNDLAKAYLLLERYEEALVWAESSLALTRASPFSAEAHLLAGLALTQLKRRDEALAAVDKSLANWEQGSLPLNVREAAVELRRQIAFGGLADG